MKRVLLAAFALLLTAPAMAGENNRPAKGTKSYQAGRSGGQADKTAAETKAAQDVQALAPAAGDVDSGMPERKSMREEIRLPRK